MTELVTALSPLLLASVAVPLPTPELVAHSQWLHVWLPTLGLLGMGLRGVFGGGADDDDDEAAGGSDPLGDGFGENFQDEGDDFGALGDEDEAFDEVEPRIDDLETELDDLESTVSAVHADNEAVQESLDEIEDNVRKLLEVYDVVTQGMNPFADDAPALGGAGGGTGAFGLLEDDDEPAEEDVESLFEDAVDEGSTEEEVEALFDEAVGDEDGVTFDELKSEFEFVGDQPEDADGDEPTVEEADEVPDANGATAPQKPYLEALPSGFGAELLVMEWLDFLVSESSVAEAMQAFRYYGTVEWISEDVATHLQTVLSGMSPPRALAATDGGRPAELSVDHHTESLEYVSQLRALDGQSGSLSASPGHRVGDREHRQEGHGVQR